MASLRALAKKLQTALLMQGRRIAINQFQSYSEKQGTMNTKYVCSDKDSDGKYRPLFESWQLAEVVKFLAGELSSGGDSSCH